MMASRNNKRYGWLKRKYSEVNKANAKFMHTEAAHKKRSATVRGVPKPEFHKKAISEAKMKTLEYKGKFYKGFTELHNATKVTYHLYRKYYMNGLDPEPFIGNNTYAMIDKMKTAPHEGSRGKRWFSDGVEEIQAFEKPIGWYPGRLNKSRNSQGRYAS